MKDMSSEELCKALNAIMDSYKEIIPDDKKEGKHIKFGVNVMKQAVKAIEQRDEMARLIARNIVAWDTSKNKREGLLPEVYLSNKSMYEKITGEEYIFHKAIERYKIGD